MGGHWAFLGLGAVVERTVGRPTRRGIGFFPTATEVILQEHRFRPITGRALMIGRQNTGLLPGEAKHLIVQTG
jgi:hypothetical protein